MVRFSFVTTAVLVACGARTELRGQLQQDASASDAFVINECGAADGPAIAIAINAVASCEEAITNQQNGTWIYFIAEPIPSGTGNFVIGNGDPNGKSGAYVCDSSGQCAAATDGTLVITTYDANTLAGSYTLHLPNSTATGTFSAAVCHNHTLCG